MIRITLSRIARARKSWFVHEKSCIVTNCGYTKLSRGVRAMQTVDGKETLVQIHLCPKHLFEYRCGFIEPWTWVEKDIEALKLKPKEQEVIDATEHSEGNAGS